MWKVTTGNHAIAASRATGSPPDQGSAPPDRAGQRSLTGSLFIGDNRRNFTMRTENIAHLLVIDGHLHFDPSPRFQALGFDRQDLGPADDPTAREKADEMFRRCRLAKRADKDARILAKAEKIKSAAAADA